ncbi:uncharacterized protein PG986_008630 [Apiospora aurea]|uniref:Uncharacterized protein n=1 Tax=Apiospora aurea TaxID=335848 RepID=A0ABR1Q5U8_9PEZI
MSGSSDRCVYGGEIHSKPSHFVADSTESPSKASIPSKNVKSYIKSKNGGGDPTALALRPSLSDSVADRRAKVERDMAASLAVLNEGQ